MPGISVLISEVPSSGPNEGSFATPRAALPSFRIAGRHCVGRISHLGAFNHRVLRCDTAAGVGLALDGWVLPSTDSRTGEDACDYCWRRFRDEGIDFVTQLNGSFNILAWDDRTGAVFWATDRYGTRPSYHGTANGTFCIAPRAAAVLAGLGCRPRLDRKHLVNQLVFNRIWNGDSTLFSDVRVVRGASILHWQGNRLRHRTYWDYHYDPVKEVDDGFIDAAAEIARSVTADHLALARRPAISLSGGLDSRTVLAAVPAERRPTLPSFTWGASADCDEVLLAGQTAVALRSPWRLLPLAPRDFLRHAVDGIRASDGLDIFVQSYARAVYPQIAQRHDALLTGLGLEYTFGGRYVQAGHLGANIGADAGLEFVRRSARTLSPTDAAVLLRLPDLDEQVRAVGHDIAADFHGGPSLNTADRVNRYFSHQRGRKMLFLRPIWFRDDLEHLFPIFDNRWIDFALRIPAAWRADNRFYRRFLIRLHPECAAIPYQRTMLPVTAPVESWDTAERVETEREQALRTKFFQSGGKVFLPYKRYYSNFDEWLRLDPEWIAFTNALLLDQGSLIYQGILRPEPVATRIAEHRTAEGTHYSLLIQLMSLELTLREFFPAGVA